ncbi:hypothetical protein M0638_21385 [Roseomonas sp. NAR14]|uniref:Uncharacterized protein n=1 Tax=Roseomonas acroporae TaxID=2937791 RepID=A0A9X1YIR8_9PROT|nr:MULTISPECIES: hypothetical protein [Roseomonas]MCG7352873.1 hypothetical protein [Roseomonas mucosa]MCG7356147.1 hypothetical protein [Roseomonas mucosa]MCK8786931.1 hypothetical protein [Roseomonas acroporae]MDT8294205.1 hypothetical protein [Roseomonas mucosa]UFN51796.1 hypothetical protein LPC08_25945 [Roseomonas sp. OT10]
MARTDKDVGAKAQALRFCVSAGFIPYLEVDVLSGVELSASPKRLTDIDVLGVGLRSDGTVGRTLFDCKSVGGPAFARALWLSGLLTFTGGDEGFMLMGKPVERAHRLAARKLKVRIFGADAFDGYASAASAEYKILKSYAGDIENWHRVRETALKNPAILEIFDGINYEVPLCADAPKAFRRLIASCRKNKGELNPAKPLHMATFAEIVLAVSILVAVMIGDLRNIIELADNEKEFSTALRYYVWGGHENIELLKRMHDLIAANGSPLEQESSLIAWPLFVQLVRGMLESPTQVRNACFPLRDISLRYLADTNEAADLRVGRLFLAPRARQFAKRVSSYVAAVLKLPNEFAERLGQDIDDLVMKAEAKL